MFTGSISAMFKPRRSARPAENFAAWIGRPERSAGRPTGRATSRSWPPTASCSCSATAARQFSPERRPRGTRNSAACRSLAAPSAGRRRPCTPAGSICGARTCTACLYVGKPERLEGRFRDRTRPASAIVDAQPPDWTWVVGGEREYPADLLSLNELTLWYGVSLGVFALAAAVAFPGSWILARLLSGPNAACGAGVPPARNAAETAARQEVLPGPLKPGSAGAAPARPRGLGGKSRLAMPLFFSLAFLFGGLATPVVNKSCGCFALSWPVCLFVAHQTTLVALLWAAPRRTSRVAPWVSLFAVLAFLGVCLLYFDLCRRAGLAPAWVFLFGFLPAWPAAVPAARKMLRGGPAWIQWLWIVVSFSLFFWAAAGVNFCRY